MTAEPVSSAAELPPEVAPAPERAFAASPAAPPSAWQRFVDRFIPAEERSAALWIAGSAAVLGALRALAYPPIRSLVTRFVVSPRLLELGFPLRATAIADVIWGVLVGLLVWALLRYTKAPRAVALYLVLSGVLLGAVTLGGRLALNAATVLIAPQRYAPTLWNDLQPMMLTLAEAVGVVLGAWLVPARADEVRTPQSGTLLPALGWTGRPLQGAARLAVAYAGVRVVTGLVITMLTFAAQAAQLIEIARSGGRLEGLSFSPMGLAITVFVPCAYVAAGYIVVRRYGGPVSIWLAFLAGSIPGVISALMFLPQQLQLMAPNAGLRELLIGSALVVATGVVWPISALTPLLGVWLATRPTRVSVPSDTLPAENTDHGYVAGGTDG
jgi:hypothetical protein